MEFVQIWIEFIYIFRYKMDEFHPNLDEKSSDLI